MLCISARMLICFQSTTHRTCSTTLVLLRIVDGRLESLAWKEECCCLNGAFVPKELSVLKDTRHRGMTAVSASATSFRMRSNLPRWVLRLRTVCISNNSTVSAQYLGRVFGLKRCSVEILWDMVCRNHVPCPFGYGAAGNCPHSGFAHTLPISHSLHNL
jgi:hypothetical protein